jgi:hypothetical protein
VDSKRWPCIKSFWYNAVLPRSEGQVEIKELWFQLMRLKL